MNSRYIETAVALLEELDRAEAGHIKEAGDLIADSLTAGGIMITFGSGHSLVGAKEVVDRAGGLFQAKMIRDPSDGAFEKLEGSGLCLLRKVQILPEDVVIIISNSGRNPAGIEIALAAKERGAKVIAVTALESSMGLPSRHSSGKKLYEIADVILDLHTVPGDAAMEVEGLDAKICGTSTIATVALLQSAVLSATETMVSRGYIPEVRISANVDSAPANRSALIEQKYADRIYRI